MSDSVQIDDWEKLVKVLNRIASALEMLVVLEKQKITSQKPSKSIDKK